MNVYIQLGVIFEMFIKMLIVANLYFRFSSSSYIVAYSCIQFGLGVLGSGLGLG